MRQPSAGAESPTDTEGERLRGRSIAGKLKHVFLERERDREREHGMGSREAEMDQTGKEADEMRWCWKPVSRNRDTRPTFLQKSNQSQILIKVPSAAEATVAEEHAGKEKNR